MRSGATAAVVLTLALLVPSPAARGEQDSAFRIETRLVVLQVTVKNSRGELVTSLEQNAFAVYENGARQPIMLFRRDDVPVSLGLLIDNSGSMQSLRAKVEAAALAFVRASNPEDEVFVVNFADKPRIDVPLTSDPRVLERGIGRFDSIGGTALRDALHVAHPYLDQHATRDRKVLLIITDGNDNASVVTPTEVEREAQRSGTVIYAIGLFGDDKSAAANRGRHELDRLTSRTGGLVYYPASIEQIDSLVIDLARQIRSQYTIAYAPINQTLDGSYRSIRVEATGGGRLVVRTRAGYRAAPR